MNYHLRESIFALVLILAAVLLVNPLGIWMPTVFHMSMLAVVVAAMAGIAAFMIRERPIDERDDAHRMLAGRAAFLAGSAILLVGIIHQTLSHSLDPYLVVALVGMAIAKVASRWWSDRNR